MKQRIRPIEVSDAFDLRDIYAPFVSDSATSFEATPPEVSEMERRISDLHVRFPWLVLEADGKVLGYAYASPHRARRAYQWSAEVSVYIHSHWHHRGLGRALYTALFEVLRRQGYFNAFAGITLPNPASVGLHESLGFKPAGIFERAGFKFGQWHDVIWLQLRLLEGDPSSVGDPLPAKELLGDERILALFEECAKIARL